MKIKHAILGLALAGTVAIPAIAEDFEDQIEGRKAYMQVLKYNMGILGGMAKGQIDYDSALASAAAKNMAAAASMDNGSMWPPGSGLDKVSGTDAKPEIWSTYPKVAEHGEAFDKAAIAMVDLAGKDLKSLRKGMGALGKSCKSCHDDFKD